MGSGLQMSGDKKQKKLHSPIYTFSDLMSSSSTWGTSLWSQKKLYTTFFHICTSTPVMHKQTLKCKISGVPAIYHKLRGMFRQWEQTFIGWPWSALLPCRTSISHYFLLSKHMWSWLGRPLYRLVEVIHTWVWQPVKSVIWNIFVVSVSHSTEPQQQVLFNG